MEHALTDNQRKWLTALTSGEGALPIKPFSSLRDLGLVTATGKPSGRRGYTSAELTEKGRAAAAG